MNTDGQLSLSLPGAEPEGRHLEVGPLESCLCQVILRMTPGLSETQFPHLLSP